MVTEDELQRYQSISRGSRIIRDLLLVVVGVLVLIATPASISAIGLGGAASVIWASMYLVGGALALWGVYRCRSMMESVGCSLVAGAFVVWAGALVLSPASSLPSYALALVLVSSAFGQIYRITQIEPPAVVIATPEEM